MTLSQVILLFKTVKIAYYNGTIYMIYIKADGPYLVCRIKDSETYFFVNCNQKNDQQLSVFRLKPYKPVLNPIIISSIVPFYKKPWITSLWKIGDEKTNPHFYAYQPNSKSFHVKSDTLLIDKNDIVYTEVNCFNFCEIIKLQVTDIIKFDNQIYIKCRYIAVSRTIISMKHVECLDFSDISIHVYCKVEPFSLKTYSCVLPDNSHSHVHNYVNRSISTFLHAIEYHEFVDIKYHSKIRLIPDVTFNNQQMFGYQHFHVVVDPDCENIDGLVSNRSLIAVLE